MNQSKPSYQIRKTLINQGVSVIMNDSLGQVLEFENWEEASQLTIILNSNSDSNCRYEIVVVKSE